MHWPNGWVGSTDAVIVWAWMPWPMDGMVAWTLSWFGHGCIGQMDGLVARTLSLFGHGCTGPWMGW